MKRLAASFEIAGRDRDFTDAERDSRGPERGPLVPRVRCGRSPRRRNLDVWYARLDVDDDRGAAARSSRRRSRRTNVAKAAAKARTKDSMKAFAKLTELRRRRAADRLATRR